MRRRILAVAAAVGAVTGLVASEPSVGQIFPEGPLKVQFEFNFSNPGARSLGLGGAFLARADDATAAYVNPAGLESLRNPEVLLEGRSTKSGVVFRDTSGNESPVAGESSTSGLSFLSVTYPFKHLTLGVFRHELANFSVSSGSSTLFDSAAVDLDIVGVGFSAGVRVTSNLSIGASLVGYEFDLDASQVAADESVAINGREGALGFNLGLMWDFSDGWHLGWVIRNGPSFDVSIGRDGSIDQRSFSVPDLVGLGLSWQATHGLVVSVDYYLVQYSLTVDSEIVEGGRFAIPDAHEVRAGLEYTLWQYSTSPALRVGVWRDPAHNVRFFQHQSSPEADALARAFPPGDDETHISLGGGVVFSRFQLDAGADFSETTDTFSLSVIMFF